MAFAIDIERLFLVAFSADPACTILISCCGFSTDLFCSLRSCSSYAYLVHISIYFHLKNDPPYPPQTISSSFFSHFKAQPKPHHQSLFVFIRLAFHYTPYFTSLIKKEAKNHRTSKASDNFNLIIYNWKAYNAELVSFSFRCARPLAR